MPVTPTPTTELDAVNVMLGAIGETPVNSIGGESNADVAVALKILRELSKEVQSEGWHFNTESDYPLAPDQDGYIQVPLNTVRVDADQYAGIYDIALRGQKLYDKLNHTYTFDQTLKVEIVLFLPFEELPETARRYITIRAARIFQARYLGSETLDGFTEDQEKEARRIFKKSEGADADLTIFDSPDIGNVILR